MSDPTARFAYMLCSPDDKADIISGEVSKKIRGVRADQAKRKIGRACKGAGDSAANIAAGADNKRRLLWG
ncbi:hypothetical protein V502_04748 [Pseudogymnoascus sp. VKM F-4520 (FW-2644)]|nr:hypothetical protein V502_04748 [Pseudogymnoascus sp. VKM F-4520 (FW-2644)]